MKAVLFLFPLLLSGCMPCRNDECPEGRFLRFRVQDQENRSLLPWSRFPQEYASDSVRVVGLSAEGKEKSQRLRLEKGILSFLPETNIKNYLIRYSFAPNDTLALQNLQVYLDKCCEETVTDYEVNVDGNFTIGDGNTVFIFTK